jgi:hypothetical protein
MEQPIDLAKVPLGWLPHGIGTGASFSVELVGRSGNEGLIRVQQQNPIAAMNTDQLGSFLQQQMATRNATNPPAPPVLPPQQPMA